MLTHCLPIYHVLTRGDLEHSERRTHACRTQRCLSMLASTSSKARLSSPHVLQYRRSRSGYSQRAIRHVTYAAGKKNSGYAELLKGVDSDNAEVVSRVLEKAMTAADRWDTVYTDFLSPAEVADAKMVLERVGDVTCVAWGGYMSAERQRLALGRTEMLAAESTAPEDLLALLSVEGNFMFDPATHRDFLGAVLGTGIDRKKVGDIVVQGEQGAQILVVPELAEYLKTSLTSVRSVQVMVEERELSSLRVAPPKVQDIRSVEASLRLDAIASAGFRMPRSKCVTMISSGDVRVNWKEVTKGGKNVQSGDIISIRGKGRLEVGEIQETKKGRFVVNMTRYV